MLRLALQNPGTYRRSQRIPLARRCFVVHLESLDELTGAEHAAAVSRVLLPNGVRMETESNRFHDLDPITLELLDPRENVIHDVAVANGVTTVELLQNLQTGARPFRLIFSERNAAVGITGGIVKRMYSIDGEFLGVYLADFLLAEVGPGRLRFLSRWIARFLEKPRPAMFERTISLLDQRLQEALKLGHVEQIPYDLFQSSIPDRFTYVRCMNVLNFAYFDEPALRRALELLIVSLREGGVLQLGRTTKRGVNRATFFRKTGNRVAVETAVNGGSELEALMR
jgi:hypothetical protein